MPLAVGVIVVNEEIPTRWKQVLSLYEGTVLDLYLHCFYLLLLPYPEGLTAITTIQSLTLHAFKSRDCYSIRQR